LAESSSWAINRLISVIVPVILLPLLVSKGAISMCGAQAGTLIVSAALLAIAAKGQAGWPVLWKIRNPATARRVTDPRYSMLNFRGVKLKSTERARLM
jgi:hypothetical protein